MEIILSFVDQLIADWRAKLGPEIDVVLGGSLASGTFVLDGATCVDVDVRFLSDRPNDIEIRRRIVQATGLAYRKTIRLDHEWPNDNCDGIMIEGKIDVPDIAIPLEIEGCLRNRDYICWAEYFQKVLSTEELEEYVQRKIQLRENKDAYKAFKWSVLSEVKRRAIGRGIVPWPKERPAFFKEVFSFDEVRAHLIGRDLHITAPSCSRFFLSTPYGPFGPRSERYYCDCGKSCPSVPAEVLAKAVRAAMPYGATRVILRFPKIAMIEGLPTSDVGKAVWDNCYGGGGEIALGQGYTAIAIEPW